MPNIKLTVAYDGTHYLGWQKTKEGPSIEECLEQVLEQILQHPVTLNAAGRTDTGVHARGQVVNFFSENYSLDREKLKKSLNSLLPSDIAVLAVEAAPDSFHATTSCIGKEYHYRLCNAEVLLPQYRHTCWHYAYALDVGRMHYGAHVLAGTYNYKSLTNSKPDVKSDDFQRRVDKIDIIEEGEEGMLLIKVSGEKFLYKMVRNLVGTLAYVGRGLIRPEQLPSILESGDRTRAGITAPAHGLSLHRVFYNID